MDLCNKAFDLRLNRHRPERSNSADKFAGLLHRFLSQRDDLDRYRATRARSSTGAAAGIRGWRAKSRRHRNDDRRAERHGRLPHRGQSFSRHQHVHGSFPERQLLTISDSSLAIIESLAGRSSLSNSAVAVGALCALAVLSASAFQGGTVTYTMYTAEAKRSVVVRPGSPDTVALEQLAGTFGLTFTEDRAANGLVIGTRGGQQILAFPGQSFIRTAGKIVQL